MFYLDGRKYKKPFKSFGTNTFSYDEAIDYIHFFLYPESAEYYANSVPTIFGIVTCDIPDELLEDHFGYGYYSRVIPGTYAPVPEFAIPLNDFSLSYISSIDDSDSFQESVKDHHMQDYLDSLSLNYTASFEGGHFSDGYDMYSVLEMDKPFTLKKKN